ncbi:hypothetical protein FCV25MIE_07811 [Fagus crenata]
MTGKHTTLHDVRRYCSSDCIDESASASQGKSLCFPAGKLVTDFFNEEVICTLVSTINKDRDPQVLTKFLRDFKTQLAFQDRAVNGI